MAAYKDEKTNTWRVLYRYTDWNGERKQTQKRGFKTKREAQAWEREQLNKISADLDMTFRSFVDLYTADMKTRLKENTWATKDHIIRTKLLPYFGRLKMCNITAQQIITWQNEMLNHKDENGKPYSPVYLKTVHNQLSAIFNHAVRYYNLRENPCKKAGSMGKKKNREMLFWTKAEYLKGVFTVYECGADLFTKHYSARALETEGRVFRLRRNGEITAEKTAMYGNTIGQYTCEKLSSEAQIGDEVILTFFCRDESGLGYEFLLQNWVAVAERDVAYVDAEWEDWLKLTWN